MHPGRDETGTIRLGPTSTRTGGATQASGTDDGTESTTSSTSATGTGPAPPGMPITVIISGKPPTGLRPLLSVTCGERTAQDNRHQSGDAPHPRPDLSAARLRLGALRNR